MVENVKAQDAKKKPPTKLKTFRIPAEHYTELTQQINQLINSYKT